MHLKHQFLILSLLLPFALARAHGNHHHHSEKPGVAYSNALKLIGGKYNESIKTVFSSKCMDCHARDRVYPWYHEVPGIRQKLDEDRRTALEHVDMTNGFPFKGHGSPEDDLQAIIENLSKEKMPPSEYLMVHSEAKLSTEEMSQIITWARVGLKDLEVATAVDLKAKKKFAP